MEAWSVATVNNGRKCCQNGKGKSTEMGPSGQGPEFISAAQQKRAFDAPFTSLSTFNLEYLNEEYLYQEAIRTRVPRTDQLETETG